MSLSQNSVHVLTEKLLRYILLYQDCSDKVRPIGLAATNPIYDKVYKEWQIDPSNPLVEPPLGDKEKLAAYFAKCDAICALKADTTHDIYKVSFAAWAGMQVVQSKVLADMPTTGDKIIADATELAFRQYQQRNPDVRVLPTSPNSMDPELPSHLTHTCFPNHDASTPNPAGEFGVHLLGTTIKFRDPETLEVIDCTIQDYGTSQLKGDWYEVVYGETDEMRITAKEMKEILDNSV